MQLPARTKTLGEDLPQLHRFTQDQQMFLTRARRCLQAAQDRQKYYFDRHVSPVKFQVGQKVLLSTKNINLAHPGSNKLLPKWIGPFIITKQVGPVAFQLELPDTLRKLHPVFHASLMTHYNDKGGFKPLPPILMDDGSLEFEVERILDSRLVKRGSKHITQYYIKWLGYDHNYYSWEPEANLHCPDLLRKFLHERPRQAIQPTASNNPSPKLKRRRL